MNHRSIFIVFNNIYKKTILLLNPAFKPFDSLKDYNSFFIYKREFKELFIIFVFN